MKFVLACTRSACEVALYSGLRKVCYKGPRPLRPLSFLHYYVFLLQLMSLSSLLVEFVLLQLRTYYGSSSQFGKLSLSLY